MKKFVVLDNGQFSRSTNCEELANHLSGEVSWFRTVGDFLLESDNLRTANIVVMERCLALKDERPQLWHELMARHPGMATGWNSMAAYARVIKWMRANDMRMLVLLYTDYEVEALRKIDEDILADPMVIRVEAAENPKPLWKVVQEHLAQAA